MTIFSPKSVGDGGNAEVEFLLFPVADVLDHDAAVLRQPLFADVQLGHDLDAAGHRVFQFHRRSHHVLQNAVDAEPDAVFLLVRLHVDVAGAALHGVGQDQVAELDDGSFLGRSFERRQIHHFRFFAGEFERGVVGGQVLHHLVEFFYALDFAVEFVNRLADRRFGSHHWLDVEASHELDVVHREDVRRISHRNRESGANPRERDDLIANGGLLRNQLDDGGVDLVELQVDGRDPVLTRKHRRDVVIAHQAQFYEAGTQAAAVLLLIVERLLQLIRGDQAVLNQDFAES